MNEAIALKTYSEILNCPMEIKDVLLMANCRDISGGIFGGSQIIGVGALELTTEEKMILLAEFVKRLRIEIKDLADFLGQTWGVYK